MIGGGGVRTVLGQDQMVNTQMTNNPPTAQSRYPQRDRVQITRTSHRAISNVYPFKNTLSQIDSDDEDPPEMNLPKIIPKNYQYQQPTTIPVTKTEEQKFFEGDSESKINKFFGK